MLRKIIQKITSTRLAIRLVHSSQSPSVQGLKILFGALHSDIATAKILKRLIPSIRYFKDEVPKNVGFDGMLQELDTPNETYDAAQSLYEANNLDIENPKHHETFMSIWFKTHGITTESIENLDVIQSSIAEQRSARVNANLLRCFKEKKIRYEACDLDFDFDTTDPSLSTTPFFEMQRSKNFVDNYLSTKETFHARNGIAHFPHFQLEILKRMSIETAKDTFMFFHIFSQTYSDIS